MIELLSLYPMLFLVIYLIYEQVTGGELNMEAVIIAAIITVTGTLIGIFVKLFISSRRDTKSFEDIEDDLRGKHTLEKAEKYHDITMSKLDYSKEILKESQYKIEKVSDGLIEASAEIEKVSDNFSVYMQNIMSASKSKNEVLGALSIVESVVQENGVLHSHNDQLIIKNQQLEIDNSRLVMENELLISKVRQLQRENRKTKDDFDLEL